MNNIEYITKIDFTDCNFHVLSQDWSTDESRNRRGAFQRYHFYEVCNTCVMLHPDDAKNDQLRILHIDIR